MLPNLSRLCLARVGVGAEDAVAAGSKRKRPEPGALAESRIPNDQPLVSTITHRNLPGDLKISNACFVERMSRVRASNVGLVVNVTDPGATGNRRRLGGARVVYHRFNDSTQEPVYVIVEALRATVADVQEHWRTQPGTAVLIHCSAGQNRSAAAVLAVLLAYGVPEVEAVLLVEATRTADAKGPGAQWEGTGWEKFDGPSGERLRDIVLTHLHKPACHEYCR